jgi:hypothetical protein
MLISFDIWMHRDAQNTALERQDLPCMYLAHQEPGILITINISTLILILLLCGCTAKSMANLSD